MTTTRREMLAAAGVGLAALEVAGATPAIAGADARADIEKIAAELAQRSAVSNAALMRGDVDAYRQLITHTDDFTLMAPFGGAPTRGADMTRERWEAMRRFFKNGTLSQELVRSYGSNDMVVLAVIERAHVEVGGLPAQDWGLRVTLVYRRDGSEWRLAHRHADPLAQGISLTQAAALARGGGEL